MSFGRDIGSAMASGLFAWAVLVFLAGGAFFGFVFFGIPWLWRAIKPWLHQVTG